MQKVVARIFEDVGGYYICSDDLPYLDMRGYAYRSKRQALLSALEQGYTHAIGSGTYHPYQVRSIKGMVCKGI